MSYRSHTTIPMRGHANHSLIAVVLVGAVALTAVAAFAWHVYGASQDARAARERDKAAAISAVISGYQQGQRDALEALFAANGVSLRQACRTLQPDATPGDLP